MERAVAVGGRPLCHPLLPRKRPRTPAVGAGVGRLSNPNVRQGVKGRATTSDSQALNSLVLRAASKLARVKRVSWLCAMPFCLRSPNPKMGAREKSTLDPTRGWCRVGEWRICAGAFSGESIARQAPQHGENTGLEIAQTSLTRVAATHPLVTIPRSPTSASAVSQQFASGRSHMWRAPQTLVPCTNLVRLDLPRPRPARRPTHTTSQCAVKP